MQGEIQEYHRGQLEKDGIFLPPKEATVLTISGNFTQKDLDKAAKKGTKKQSNIAAPSIENPLHGETLNDAIAASTATKKATKRSVKSKFYDGDLASLPVKGELSISSLFGSIPLEYKANHKAGFNQGNIKKDIAIPYIEAYRKTLT